MNKIFKVVWSKSKNCYVVVSEFAKNNSGKKKIVVAAILAALAMTNASISMAANTLPTKLHATAVGLGDGASVTGDKAVGFGQNAAAAGGYSIAIGSNSSTSVNSPQGIAIGGGNTANEGARVIGEQAIAIGGNTIAQGNSSIVIGGDDVVKADGVKVIYTTNNGEIQTGDLRSAVQSLTGFDMRNPLYTTATAGESGITLGMKGQSGNVGIAIGTGANAKDRLSGPSGQANNDVTNAIAIGTGARANRDNAIAIGGGSNTDVGGTKQSSYTLPNNVVASWAGGDKTLPGDVVSFGSKGYERQLKHVAPGEVSATSTDAINGSQLSAIVDQIAYKYISIKSSDVANKDNTGATADNSIAIGPNAATDTSASRSVAVGDGARGKVVDGVAVGSKSIADIASGVAGYNVNASRTDIYAGLSGAALTSKLGGVAVGTINQTRQINYVAAGTADTDAVNVAQLKSVNLAFTGDTGTGDVNLANSKLAVNGDNTYISTTANGKKITVSGKKQDITVANGSATASAGMADSANVANAINQAIDQNKYGWNLSANGEATPVAVEKGNTVDFSGDDNVAVARNDKKISVALKKDLSKLNSASFNNAGGNETVKIDGDKGINAGNLKVANVADGVADKDAVNVSQLKKVDDKTEANKTAIDTNKTAIAKNVGDITTNKTDIATNKDSIAANTQKIADNKTVIDKNTGEIATNKADIATNKDNIATNKANIDKNTTAIARKISLGGNNGSTDEKSLSTGDVKFNVKGENGLTTVANGDDVTVKLDDATKGKVDNAADRDLSNLTPDGKQQVKELAAWNVVANNETAEKVEGGNTVKFIDGDNISITQNGKDFTISTKKDVTFDTVTATQTITAPKVKATTGVETPQVTGLTNTTWVPGQTQPVSGRAATEDQLKQVDNQVVENKANIADNKDKIGKNADAIADNRQKIADNKTAIDKNAADITTNKDNIADNKQKIADNKTAIDKNTSDIATNKTDIATNKDNIADNKQKIADNKTAIDKNIGDIATNKADIATNKDNIDKNTTAIGRKISLGGNSGSTNEKSLSTGDVKFNVKGENGLTTVANGDDVTVKLDDATKGKVDNAADRDLSNLTPDGKQQVKELAAWNVVANNETAEKVEGGNTVKFIDGDNISITQNGKDFTISTKKDVTFDTVTATQTITAPKVKATTGVETPQVTGLTNTAWVPGQTQPVSGRAATEDQLKHVDDQVAGNKAKIADNTDKIGKNADAIADNKQKIADNKAAIDKNAGDIATNKDNIAANKQNIADNKAAITKNASDIATNKDNIDKNTTAIGRKISLGGNSGSTNEKSLSTGDVKFNVKGENGLTTVANGDDVTVKLDDATKGKVDNAADRDLSNLTPDGKQQVKELAAWNVVANNETAEKVEGGNTVKFIDGDNISITQNGKDFTISTKKDVTFDTVTATQTITAPKVKATTGVETPQVTGLTNTTWVPGQTQPVSGRAATEDQLKQVDNQVVENKANIADNKDKIGKNADAIADNRQKIADNKTAIDKNAADITTNKDNIADNKQKIADNKTAIDKNTSDIATNKTDIATNKDNIADNKQKIADNKTAIDKNTGDIATNKADISTNKDNIAINKANIDKNTTAIGRKISLGGNSGSTDEKSLSTGDVKFNVKGENGLTTVANGDDVTVKLDDMTKGKIENAADRDLSNLTPDGKQQVKELAAWNVVANNETAEKVEGGNTVKFIDGDNISITQNGKDFTISTKKDVTFDTVTATQTITAPKVKATTGVETPQVTGLTNTAWVPGQTQPVSGRAATEDQLKHVDDQVAGNKAKIADNTDKIGKNADAIADNKQKIADNKAAIDKNAGDIATNKDNIAANKQNIADNKAAITKNASDIATNKDNIDKNTTAIGRKISLGGNSGSTNEKSLSTGDVKFNVKGENGLTTVANGDDVTVKLDDMTKGKIENAADRDLSNLTPDGKQQVKELAAWNVVANNETAEKVEGGNTVKFIDGDNISITQNGKDFTISTKKDVTFDTVTATQTITAPKVKATTGVETPQVTGLTNTAWVPGQTQPVSGRAATEDQLKHVDDQVSENKAKIADNAEAIADNKQKIADNKTAIDKNAVDIATNKDNIATNKADIATNKDNIATNKQNIADNKAAITKNAGDIAANKANIDKNTEAIGRKISLGGNTGSTDAKSLSTGDVKFNIKGQNGIVTEANGEDVTVKLDDATANKINNAANTDLSNLTDAGKQQVKDLSAWNVVANGNTAEKVEGGNTVKFIDGDNISITQNGKDFTIATKQDVTFNTVKANQTITAPKVKATEGVETPQVTGLTNTAWTPGQTQPVSGRAATEDQLKHVDDQVAENKANIADNTDKIGKNADAIADNKQKIANNKAAIDRNAADIATNKDNIAVNKQNIADNKAAITKNTSDIATNKDNIATNKANIDKNTTAIARKISLGGNSGLTDEKSLSTGDVKFNIKGENGLTTIANGEDVTVKIDDQTKAKIDNAANQDLSNLTETGKQQVNDISAWKVTAAGGTVEKVQGGDTVKFQAGDNLVVNQDRTTFTYGLAKDLKGLNSVTVGDENGVSTKITPAGTTVKDAAGNSTTINGGGMSITPADAAANPVSLTVDGLNNGGNQIHGVAPGTADTDAVNVSQLKVSNAGLQEAVNRVATETQRVGAHAAAMAALKPIQYDPLEPTQIMAGIGNYRGETAGAIGIAHYRTEDTMFNVGVSLGTSHNMVNAGVTHKFGGSRERKDAIPERYKAGPISSVYVMQDEVSSLKKENSNQKTVIANQAARLNTLEAENERQRQELAETKQGLDDLRAVVNQLLASKG